MKNISTIEDWVSHIYNIYEQANGERDFKDVLLFFYEEVGRCSQLVNRNRSEEIKDRIPHLFKWFCILYSKSNKSKYSISRLIWNKFPNICPYCNNDSCKCGMRKSLFNYEELMKTAENKKDQMPKSLDDWQALFQKLYPRNNEYDMGKNVHHLFEELAELSEVHRLYFTGQGKEIVDMELADVFSWIIGFANYFDQSPQDSKYSIANALKEQFSNGCPDCDNIRKDKDIPVCCCSIKEPKLRLVSDYYTTNNQKEDSNIHKQKSERCYI